MSPRAKPYSESCDQNGAVILEVLQQRLPSSIEVLEIGSGTGQHAVMFGRALPTLRWHTSDRRENHDGIKMWLDEAGLDNVQYPLALDVLSDPWPNRRYHAVFSANTAHIMSESAVEAMFRGLAKVLQAGGEFLLYGPFQYDGQHTSDSNRSFDLWLKRYDPVCGVRDVRWLEQVAAANGLGLYDDIAMPANNRILVWRLRGIGEDKAQ